MKFNAKRILSFVIILGCFFKLASLEKKDTKPQNTDVTSFLNKSPQELKKQYNSIKTENVILYSNECKKIFFNGFQIICDEKEKKVIQVIIEDKDFRVLKYFGTDMPIQSIKDVIKKWISKCIMTRT